MTFLVEYQSIAPFPPLVLAKLVEAFAEPYYIAAKMRVSINDIVIYILIRKDIQSNASKLFTAIHLCLITSSIESLMVGSVFNIPWIRLFASLEMFSHSGLGNSYWPERIRFFIPGEIARPWLL